MELISDYPFVKTLFDALPCGLIVIDGKGNILTLNAFMEETFGIEAGPAVGKPFGYALGCINAIDGLADCGSSNDCQACSVWNLAITSIFKNQRQKTQATLLISANGQVRDMSLSIRVLPFVFAENRFAALIIELKNVDNFAAAITKRGYRGIVGESTVMNELFESIRQLAQSDAPVLIQGESGTGKELVALALHKESQRSEKNFVPVNCGALPEGLLESELFGHIKGAYTGANNAQKGRFFVADGGTLFLDEVGELSPVIQVKFLRVLQNGCFEPVGSDRTTCVDVRVISATNSNLDIAAREGRFRQDLYYRLNVMPIKVPPLRARKEDIPLLCNHFLTKFAETSWAQKIKISPEVKSVFMNYSWPGNVRELRNALQYASVRATSGVIMPADVPPNLISSEKYKVNYKRKRRLKLTDSQVTEALEIANGNRRKAAEILGVSRSTLYRFFDRTEIGKK